MSRRYNPYNVKEKLVSALTYAKTDWNKSVITELDELKKKNAKTEGMLRDIQLNKKTTDVINVINVNETVPQGEPIEQVIERTEGAIRQTIDNFPEDERERLLTSLTQEQIMKAIILNSQKMLYDRNELITQALAMFINPGLLEVVKYTEDRDETERIDRLVKDSNITLFGDMKKKAYIHVLQYLNRFRETHAQPIANDVRLITYISPSYWFVDILENGFTVDLSGKIYRDFINEDMATGRSTQPYEKVKKIRTYAPDIHHFLNRMCLSLSIISFDPIEGVNKYFKKSILCDIQILLHFALYKDPAINYIDVLKNESDYIKNNLPAVLKALTSAVRLFNNYARTHEFKVSGNSLAPVEKQQPRQESQIIGAVGNRAPPLPQTPVGVPLVFMEVLSSFIIDNIMRYNIKIQQEVALQPDRKLIERDSPIGRFLNYHFASVAELESTVKKLAKDYNEQIINVSLHGMGANILDKLDSVRILFSKMSIAARVIKLLGMNNITSTFTQLYHIPEGTNEINYIPTLAAFPGAFISTNLWESPTYPRYVAGKESPYKNPAYKNKDRSAFITWMENFLKHVPDMKTVESKFGGLLGKYKPNGSAPLNPEPMNDLIATQKGMRYLDLDYITQFSIANKRLSNTVINVFLNKADVEMQVLSSFYQYIADQQTPKDGKVLSGGEDSRYNIPANYMTNQEGKLTFCKLPLSYYINTVETREVQGPGNLTYKSAYQTETNNSALNSILRMMGTQLQD